jgi:glutamine amidotransferase
MGIAWATGDSLQVRKALTIEEFLPMLEQKPDESPYVLHFRFATHGAVNLDNCHPFTIGGGTAVAHNGVLPWRSTEERSDTRCFARDILRPNRREVWGNTFQNHIEDFIGQNNKLAFVNKFGDVTIYNEHCGHWVGNIWFSNYSYRSYSGLACGWASKDDEATDFSQAGDDDTIEGHWTATDEMFRNYYRSKR